MANEPTEVFVFTDASGNFYQVPRATFEQWRVPDDQKADIERMLGRDDVAGFGQESVPQLNFVGISTYSFKQGWPIKYG